MQAQHSRRRPRLLQAMHPAVRSISPCRQLTPVLLCCRRSSCRRVFAVQWLRVLPLVQGDDAPSRTSLWASLWASRCGHLSVSASCGSCMDVRTASSRCNSRQYRSVCHPCGCQGEISRRELQLNLGEHVVGGAASLGGIIAGLHRVPAACHSLVLLAAAGL